MKLSTHRIILLLIIALHFLIMGMQEAFVPSSIAVYYLLRLGLGFAFCLFCLIDSKSINKPVVHAFVWCTFFSWHFLVPAYMIWSRGWKGLGLSLVFAFLFFSLYLGAFMVSYFFIILTI